MLGAICACWEWSGNGIWNLTVETLVESGAVLPQPIEPMGPLPKVHAENYETEGSVDALII